MNQRITTHLLNMDIRNVEVLLALHCGPVIASIKPANLLVLNKDLSKDVRGMLDQTNLTYMVVLDNTQQDILFIYNKVLLNAYLTHPEVIEFLKKYGYWQNGLEEVLSTFQTHYESYNRRAKNFPHEIGVLLGYPLEDVIGFINNKGKNSLFTGYWKVYEALPEKLQMFYQYDVVREDILRLLLHGVCMVEIINSYSTSFVANTILTK